MKNNSVSVNEEKIQLLSNAFLNHIHLRFAPADRWSHRKMKKISMCPLACVADVPYEAIHKSS